MDKLIIREFRPVCLTLDRVGPFQESLYSIDFTDKDNIPCNFYMLVAANGFGKTTVLDAISCVMNLLDEEHLHQYGMEDLDSGNGRIQLDVSVRYSWQGQNHRIVLSIIAGDFGNENISLKVWGDEDNALEKVEAESWHRLGYTGYRLQPLSTHRNDDFVKEFLGSIKFWRRRTPDGFNESSVDFPTALCFSAYRDIPKINKQVQQIIAAPAHWGYKSSHKFSAHNEDWLYSLDSLLVWLKWLDDGKFEKAKELLNNLVFKGSNKILERVQRDPPQAVVKVNGGSHRLDRLSSGEKNIVQLLLRVGAHLTQNTILLIDEFDVHLHIRWQYMLFETLKSLAAGKDMDENINITVILTTHSTEILDTYINRLNIKEEGLIKGGHLIEKGLR